MSCAYLSEPPVCLDVFASTVHCDHIIQVLACGCVEDTVVERLLGDDLLGLV